MAAWYRGANESGDGLGDTNAEDDAEALYNELKERGAKIDYELHRKPYDSLEFGIQDLDGYDIEFGQNLD